MIAKRARERSRRERGSDHEESEGVITKRARSDQLREDAEKVLSFQHTCRGVKLVGRSDQA